MGMSTSEILIVYMLALEITINNSEPMIIAADNHVIADFSYGVGGISSDFVTFAGFDEYCSYIWHVDPPRTDDEIRICVVDVCKESVSVPSKVKRKKTEELVKYYEFLKQELSKRGLL